jgi:hypothetical protein
VKVTRSEVFGTWQAGPRGDPSQAGELELDPTGDFRYRIGEPEQPPRISLQGKWRFAPNLFTGHKLVLTPHPSTPPEDNPWGKQVQWKFKSFDAQTRTMTLQEPDREQTWHKQ